MTQMTFLPKTPADMVAEYIEVSKQEGTANLYRDLLDEEYYELREEMWRDYRTENELKEMADLLYVLYGYARVKGYNLNKAVELVHQNNMGRMLQPDGTIKRREDGKVVKNSDYPKVDLGDLV
jgi:predicted house-cleaning noncanonical NTP pyrophosphatase (MazG superfamily)